MGDCYYDIVIQLIRSRRHANVWRRQWIIFGCRLSFSSGISLDQRVQCADTMVAVLESQISIETFTTKLRLDVDINGRTSTKFPRKHWRNRYS